eukprot:6563847-Prymnesium_polylepis.1
MGVRIILVYREQFTQPKRGRREVSGKLKPLGRTRTLAYTDTHKNVAKELLYWYSVLNPFPSRGAGIAVKTEVASERIQRSCAAITPSRVAISLRGPHVQLLPAMCAAAHQRAAAAAGPRSAAVAALRALLDATLD